MFGSFLIITAACLHNMCAHVTLTSDLVDDQVHFSIGPLAQLPDHLIVLVDLQPLQVLGCDQLQLVQDVHAGSGHQRRRTHIGYCFGDGPREENWDTDTEAGQEQQRQLTAGVTVQKQKKTNVLRYKITTVFNVFLIFMIKFNTISPVVGAVRQHIFG